MLNPIFVAISSPISPSQPDSSNNFTISRLCLRLALSASSAASNEVPMPPFWAGYRLLPQTIEFWQGRRSRMHDRFRYLRGPDGWRIDRLAP